MIEVKQVRELIELMIEHGLSEIKVRAGDTVVSLRKSPSGEPVVYTSAPVAPAPVAAAPAPQAAPPAAAPSPDSELVPIPSPMVGTFYASVDPETPPFVKAGSEVGPKTPICIIEAMKVFNEIQAEVSGTIERVLVQNEQPVEFGQPLMLVRPRK